MTRSILSLLLAVGSLSLSCGSDPASDDREDIASTTSPPSPTEEVRLSPPPGSDGMRRVSGPASDVDPTRDVRTADDRMYTRAVDLRPTRDVHCRSPQLCVEAQHRDPLPGSPE